MGEHTVRIGDLSRKAVQYVFKPDIGMIRELLGKATGKIPAQFHYDCWILADEVPSFVQFEGPLQLMGPIVRIELVSPRLAGTVSMTRKFLQNNVGSINSEELLEVGLIDDNGPVHVHRSLRSIVLHD